MSCSVQAVAETQQQMMMAQHQANLKIQQCQGRAFVNFEHFFLCGQCCQSRIGYYPFVRISGCFARTALRLWRLT